MTYQTMALTGTGHYKYPVPQAAGLHSVNLNFTKLPNIYLITLIFLGNKP